MCQPMAGASHRSDPVGAGYFLSFPALMNTMETMVTMMASVTATVMMLAKPMALPNSRFIQISIITSQVLYVFQYFCLVFGV